jgi:hypothetical protein
MYGNCLTFAIYDFIKNGGDLIISFSRYNWFPHFVVQRNNKVYDLEIIKMFLYIFFYYGELRITNAEYFKHLKYYKKFKIMRRRATILI